MPGVDQRAAKPYALPTGHGTLLLGRRCLVMGILNVTPDSFSDGGRYESVDAAVRRGLDIAEQGADVLDVGGESTRPGAVDVPPAEQIRRVIPVIHALRNAGLTIPVSVDTRSAEVAGAALDAGADIVNDVSAARNDPRMPALLAERRVPFVVMHMQGTPRTMQLDPRYDDVVAEVEAFFEARAAELSARGVDVSRMIVDPGIGFGKTTAHNLSLLRAIRRFASRRPTLVGASRKRFLRELLSLAPRDGSYRQPDSNTRRSPPCSEAELQDLVAGSTIVAAHCAIHGAHVVRVHDVSQTAAALAVAAALRDGESSKLG